MKNLTKTSIITLLTLFISNCGEKVREEITERYDDGQKKVLMKYKGEGSEEVMVEKLVYSQSGDTIQWKNYDSKGVRDGKWIFYNEDGSLKGEGIYKVGKKWSGFFIDYDKYGQIWSEENYKDGKRDGKLTFYYENGQINREGNYKDGKGDGKWIVYYENGQIESEENYKDGKRDGKWTEYYENGQINFEGNYKDGKEDGKWIVYYENGQINREGNYKDGELVK